MISREQLVNILARVITKQVEAARPRECATPAGRFALVATQDAARLMARPIADAILHGWRNRGYIVLPDFTNAGEPYGFLCLTCGFMSHNRSDIEQLYCGHCHVFYPKEARRADPA